MGEYLGGIFGNTSRTQRTANTFTSPRPIAGSGTFGNQIRFNPGATDNMVSAGTAGLLPRSQFAGLTNDIGADVRQDIQGLRGLENPLRQARIRPTQERYARARDQMQRGMSRRGVQGTLANNELLRLDQQAARDIADQGVQAEMEALNSIFARQQFQNQLAQNLRGLSQDEVSQAIAELGLMSNVAGQSFGSVKQSGQNIDLDVQGDPSEGIGKAFDLYDKLFGGTGGGVAGAVGDIAGGVSGLVGDSAGGSIMDQISGLFNSNPASGTSPSGSVTGINPADHLGDFGSNVTGALPGGNITGALPGANLSGLGAANIAAMGGGSLSSAGALGGVAAQNAALATGGVDAFGALGAGLGTTSPVGAGAATVPGGALGGAAGAALGAALPLAVIGLGQMFGASKNAKGRKFAAPYFQAAQNATMTTVNGVRGLPITYKGETYLATPAIQENPEVGIANGESILAYRPATGDYGVLHRKGWTTDEDKYEADEEEARQNPDSPGGGVRYTRNPQNMSERTMVHVPTAGEIASKKEREAKKARQAAEAKRRAAIAAGNAAAARAAQEEMSRASHAEIRAQNDWEYAMWGSRPGDSE